MENNHNIIFKHIFFIGIGGISQSALATICLSEGIKVSGSDREKSNITDHLKRLGINVFIGHSAKNLIGSDVDLVVFSGAIKQDNEEILYCTKHNITLMERSEFLGYISSLYKNVIAISGVHGKTTTTGMIASIFIKANLNPTVHIGGETKNFDSNVKIGGKDFFITEACEYRESFLKLNPSVGVILNIEEDHPDYFKNLNHILNAFDTFSSQCKNLIIGEKYKSLIKRKDYSTFSLGGKADYVAKFIKKSSSGTSFSVFKKGEYWGRINLKVYGEHNIYNALSAIAVSELYDIDKQFIITGLNEFSGIKRRFDYWGKYGESIIFHDYAHHPTEISATIKTCKEYFGLPVVAFFQPHTYSRTKRLFSQFLSCFDESNTTIILPTYPAREKITQGYSAEYLYKSLRLKNNDVHYIKKPEYIQKFIKEFFDKKYLILIMGAGDINKIRNLIETC